jgi:hypothetical protein
MSFSRVKYDSCSYSQNLTENVSYMSYTLDPLKFKHCTPCRSSLGIVSGNDVSKANGNLVDLESNLFGIDREVSQCAAMRYLPGELHGKKLYKTTCYKEIDPTPKHLKSCQFFDVLGAQNAPAMDLSKCRR